MQKTTLALAAIILFLASCKKDFKYYYYPDEDAAIISQYLNLPTDIPENYTVVFPNHLTNRGLFARQSQTNLATLGRVLFYDKKLSKDQTVSCAGCHKQELAFSDDKVYSDGVYDRSTTRNSFALGSVANFSAYYGTDLNGFNAIRFFWDNRAETAADQSRGSMTNANEMDMKMHEIVEAVENQAYYAPLFRMAYGDAVVTEDRILQSIANFVNAMGSYQSPFDMEANQSVGNIIFNGNFGTFVYDQPFNGFTEAENRGKTLYNTNCASCHSGDMGRPILQLASNGLDENPVDLGVGGITGNSAENGTFKVPTLRNVGLTAPYMHDGRFKTLEEVVEFYNSGIQAHVNLHPDLKSQNQPKRMNFSAQDKQDLLAFLNTLSDTRLLEDKKFSDPFK